MYRARGWRSLHKALFLDWTPTEPPHDLHTLMKLTTSPLARKPTQMWDAKKIENTPTLPPPHPNTYPIIHTIPASYSASGPWPPFNTLQTYIFKPLVDVCQKTLKNCLERLEGSPRSIPNAFLNKSGKFNLMIDSLNFQKWPSFSHEFVPNLFSSSQY